MTFPNNDLNLEIILNFASCLSIALFFRKRIFSLLTNKKERPLLFKLIISSIPSVIVGLFLKDIIDCYLLNLNFICITLIFTSLILFSTTYLINNKKIFCDEINYYDAFYIGLFQSIALLPGISRSGTTIFGGITRNIKLSKMFEYSFFLYLIASFGAFVLSIIELDINSIPNLILPFFITFTSTYISIKIFSKLLSHKTFFYFGLYTLLISFILFLLNR